jgi:nitric oxide reductase subunit B
MPVDATRRYATLTFIRGALVALAVTLVAGAGGVLFYLPGTAAWLMRHGIEFTVLRPIHTTFASVWIFLGGIAVVHRYLEDHAGPVDTAERWRLRFLVLLWAFAGLGILISLVAGVTSGREYMGFHPVFSIPILLGWLLFAWNFFRATWRDFFGRPVYVTMWGVGVLLFIFTFLEEHAWLLPDVFTAPIVDLRVQWKATGTLVGAFNLFVYGTLYYVAEKLSGDERYAHSNLAYALLAVGLLNSFTNFGHHTYHVPQSELVKWISFLVSMAEIVILARVVWDVAGLASRRVTRRFDPASFFMVSAKWWICAMLIAAIVISVPPLNSLVHGTHVVTAHAMGTEIGIDGMILFCGISWIFAERALRAPSGLRWPAVGLNLCAGLFVGWLYFSGAIVGYTRYQHLPQPTWLRDASPIVFVVAGVGTAVVLGMILTTWLRLAFRRMPPARSAG